MLLINRAKYESLVIGGLENHEAKLVIRRAEETQEYEVPRRGKTSSSLLRITVLDLDEKEQSVSLVVGYLPLDGDP